MGCIYLEKPCIYDYKVMEILGSFKMKILNFEREMLVKHKNHERF